MDPIVVSTCATLGFASFTLEEAISSIARMGFSDVELTHLGAYCTHLPYRGVRAADVGSLLSDYGLRPVAMNVSTARPGPDGTITRRSMAEPSDQKAIVGYCTWYIDMAAELGVRVVAFPPAPREPDEAAWRRSVRDVFPVMKQIADYGKTRGVTVCIEAPHLFLLTDSVEHSLAVADGLAGAGLGVVVDSSHWGILRYDLPSYLQQLGSRLCHVHLRDSAGTDTRDFNQDLERTPGRGTVDFREFAGSLAGVGYNRHVSLEFEYRSTDLPVILDEFTRGIAHLEANGFAVRRR